MEDLRLAIIVLGVFSILGILVHGLWTIRKNAESNTSPSEPQNNNEAQQGEQPIHQDEQSEPPTTFHTEFAPLLDDPLSHTAAIDGNDIPAFSSQSDAISEHELNTSKIAITDPHSDLFPHPHVSDNQTDDDSHYDTDGIGQVRVVKQGAPAAPPSIKKEPSSRYAEDALQEVTESFPEPPSSLLKAHASDDSVVAVKTTRLEPRQTAGGEPASVKPREKVSFKERARQLVAGSDKPEKSNGKRVEPKLSEEHTGIDLDQNDQRARGAADKPRVSLAAQQADAESIEQEVLVLNVKMPDDKVMSGAALLPALLTLGFKFGEQEVFHRHANSNGKGPKLFSLANMFKPGTFNVDNMETFKTQGVSLFMILPIEGEPQQVFNMMHNAARKLADEFGGQILDARRSFLTKQSLQQYVEKIREFERKRMINKV